MIGAVADIHGNFEALARAMAQHPDVPYWICVGDLASRAGAYPEPPAPLFWIKGNNENFDRIAEWERGAAQPRHLHYIRNGTAVTVGSLSVAGLGGTFAPTWFDTPAASLPHTPRDDKRAINELLSTLRPRLHLCGHHHRFVETVRDGVNSVCLDRINRSYLLIDAQALTYDKVENTA